MNGLILSDLHLGSSVCQADQLTSFLEGVKTLAPDVLILNGDVFDSIDFRRLKKSHWRVLSLLRKLSDRLPVVWIAGNHDGPAEIISHLIGVDVVSEYILESGGIKILCVHGDAFDQFIDSHPLLTRLADWTYRLAQLLDRTHCVARMAKSSSKTFLRCAKQVQARALARMTQAGCQMVCCGHTHVPAIEDRYANSGCWTEKACHYLAVTDGTITLHEHATTNIQTPGDRVGGGRQAVLRLDE